MLAGGWWGQLEGSESVILMRWKQVIGPTYTKGKVIICGVNSRAKDIGVPLGFIYHHHLPSNSQGFTPFHMQKTFSCIISGIMNH